MSSQDGHDNQSDASTIDGDADVSDPSMASEEEKLETLKQVLEVGRGSHVVDKMQVAFTEAGQTTRISEGMRTLKRINVSESFAGTGICSALTHENLEHIKQRWPSETEDMEVVVWSQWDKSQTAQTALKNHKNCKALHRFGDIMDRVPEETRNKLYGVQERFLNMWQTVKRDMSSGTTTSGQTKREWADTLRDNMLKEMTDILCKTDYLEYAYCYECQQLCPVSPWSMYSHRTEEQLWVECAGTPCPPHSTMGNDSKWLDEFAVPGLTFVFSTMYYEPDVVVHENPKGYSINSLKKFLNMKGDMQFSSQFARPLWFTDSGKTVTPTYQVEAVCFDPEDLGPPSSRGRQYISMHLKPYVLHDPPQPFMKIFGRERMGNASSYMVAPAEIIREEEAREIEERMSGRRRGKKPRLASLEDLIDGRHFWSPTHHWALEGYESVVRHLHLRDEQKEWRVPVAIVNLSNVQEWTMGISTRSAPAILHGSNSKLFDMVAGREVTVAELWCMQGFGHPDMVRSPEHPFADALRDSLTLMEQRSLIGNSMHPSQVGPFLCFSILSTEFMKEVDEFSMI